jgi:hypothetical protein
VGNEAQPRGKGEVEGSAESKQDGSREESSAAAVPDVPERSPRSKAEGAQRGPKGLHGMHLLVYEVLACFVVVVLGWLFWGWMGGGWRVALLLAVSGGIALAVSLEGELRGRVVAWLARQRWRRAWPKVERRPEVAQSCDECGKALPSTCATTLCGACLDKPTEASPCPECGRQSVGPCRMAGCGLPSVVALPYSPEAFEALRTEVFELEDARRGWKAQWKAEWERCKELRRCVERLCGQRETLSQAQRTAELGLREAREELAAARREHTKASVIWRADLVRVRCEVDRRLEEADERLARSEEQWADEKRSAVDRLQGQVRALSQKLRAARAVAGMNAAWADNWWLLARGAVRTRRLMELQWRRLRAAIESRLVAVRQERNRALDEASGLQREVKHLSEQLRAARGEALTWRTGMDRAHLANNWWQERYHRVVLELRRRRRQHTELMHYCGLLKQARRKAQQNLIAADAAVLRRFDEARAYCRELEHERRERTRQQERAEELRRKLETAERDQEATAEALHTALRERDELDKERTRLAVELEAMGEHLERAQESARHPEDSK